MKNVFIILTLIFSKENEQWVGICEELGVSQFGDSYEETKKDLCEAVLLHLNTLEDLGERERFFKENNIKVYNTNEEITPKKTTRFLPNTSSIEFYKQSLEHSFA